ncbi:hypothetical protein [Neobacillus sp. 114]|uniref:hypothetical protein n=1 Tax=Neobacillus sp. 114 TaxID=3048535 RepID=UPI0024C26565|nr:hypothetical protein [Neobacillus sp. 114]
MTIHIQINYIASSKLSQSGTFQLRGRRPEQVALAFWKQIKKDMSYHANLVTVILNGDQDITQMVIELEKQEWDKSLDDNLPF